MSRDHDSHSPDANRRRLLQGAAALPMVGLPGLSFGQASAAVNTTRLAVTAWCS